MKTRLYESADYPLIAVWWQRHKQPAIPANVLPACGVIVTDDEGNPLAAVWLYMANNAPVAWFAWLVTDGLIEPFVAKDAIETAIGAVEKIAHDAGYKLLFTWTDARSLKQQFLTSGFTKSCEDAECFVKPV